MTVRAAGKFRKAFRTKAVQLAYTNYVRETKAVGLDRVNIENFESKSDAEFNLISQKVLSGQYKFTKFKEKLVSKGAGKVPRQLSVPTIRDRIALRILCDFLFSIFPSAKPELPQNKITLLRNEIDSGKYSHFVKIDLKNFFSTIDHKLLLSKLRRKVRISEFKELIEAAITNPTVPESNTKGGNPPALGVAQGLSISNVLAEIFMLEVDQSLKSIAPICVRYVDDILLLTDADPDDVLTKALNVLQGHKLDPHQPGSSDSKTMVGSLKDGVSFLGYQLKPNYVSVKPNNIIAFEGSIVTVFAEYTHRLRICKTRVQKDVALARFRWALNMKLTGCIYKDQRFGWIFYYSQINDLSVVRRIDNTVNKLLARFKIPVPPRPKKLLKAFFESKRRDKTTHRYIINYDYLTYANMKSFLIEIGVNLAGLTTTEIERKFHRLIRGATRKLEKDVSRMS